MKYLILLVMALGAIWWLRQQRPQDKINPKDKPPGPQIMVTCAHCGAHLPSEDALGGQLGMYCSEAHRVQKEA